MGLTLDQVEKAIQDVLTLGESVTTDDTSFTRADLGKLVALRDKLKAEQTDPSSEGGFYGRTCGGAR